MQRASAEVSASAYCAGWTGTVGAAGQGFRGWGDSPQRWARWSTCFSPGLCAAFMRRGRWRM